MIAKINTSGIPFPRSVLKISSKSEEIKPGEILEVIGDHSTFIKEVRLWCEKSNKKLLSASMDGEGKIKCLIQV